MCTLENNGGTYSIVHYAGETREVLVSESELKGKRLTGENSYHYLQSALACRGKDAFFNLYAPSPELYDGYHPASEVWQKKFGGLPAVLFAKGTSIYSGSSLSNDNGKIVAIMVASIFVGGEPRPTSRLVFMDITDEPYRPVLDTMQYRGVRISWPMSGGCLTNSGYSIVVGVGTSSSSVLQAWKILQNGEKKILASPILNSPLTGTPIACHDDTTAVSSNSRLLVGSGLNELAPLNADRTFPGITTLSASNGKAMFVADNAGGKAVYRVDLASGASEIFKSQDDSPAGVPTNVIMSGTEIYLLLTGGSATAYYVSSAPIIPAPTITKFTATPAVVEPGDEVALEWDIAGAVSQVLIDPVIGGGWGPVGKVHIRPSVTQTYTIKATGPGGTATKSVIVTVNPVKPVVSAGGVVDVASYAQRLSPGALFSVFGKGLSANSTVAGSGELPRSLGGTQVQVDGIACPLWLVSPAQINAQIPFELAPGPRKLRVIRNGVSGDEYQIVLGKYSPSVFTHILGQETLAVMQDSSWSLAGTPEAPITKGGQFVLYANGLGQTGCNTPTGSPAPNDRGCPSLANVRVYLNGQELPVGYAGSFPGYFASQINVSVHDTLAGSGKLPLVVSADNLEARETIVYVK